MKIFVGKINKALKKSILPAFLLLAFQCLYGQENLSLHFSNILFNDLVDTVEKLMPVRFFYYNNWTDSLNLEVKMENGSFSQLIDRTLKDKGLSFIINDSNKVIISKGYPIKTDFSKEYLGYLRRNVIQVAEPEYVRSLTSDTSVMISDEYRVFRIGRPSAAARSEVCALSGTVINRFTGEYVSGAVVYVEKLRTGAMTNSSGYYSLTLPKGQYQVDFRMIGMKTTRRNVIMYSDGVLDVEMNEDIKQIDAVIVTGERNNSVREVRTGIEKIYMKMLKQIPLGLGEVDLIKSSLLLPGVQTAGEGSAGYNVRGGSTDQNLVFLNNAPILNTSHFFGFFSAFNSDLISDVTLYKSGMPARYGGRLSSVMEITSSTGNRERVNVSGGLSPVTGRIMAEGPLPGKKGSFIAGARATYSDWMLGRFNNNRLKRSTAGFYDIQGKLNYDIDEDNTVSLSGYLSNDRFDYYRECAFDYGNMAMTLRWDHRFTPRLSLQTFAIMSDYRYQYETTEDSTLFSTVNYRINQKIVRSDFLYTASDRNRIEFGLDATYYTLNPGTRVPFGDYSAVMPMQLENERAVEPSVYLSDDFELTPLLSVSGGVRATLFTSFGPKTKYIYFNGVAKSEESIVDTVTFGKGDVVNSYPGVEFRFSSRYILSPVLSVKFGAQRVYQYLHMISNTTSISPTDIWKLSDGYIRPQRSDQFSLGLYGSDRRNAVSASAEAYWKTFSNILDYKGGAVLMMNEHLETDVISGSGIAYGVEFMVRKQSGTVTGWLSYTYSRALLKVNGEYDSETVNNGEFFPANYDKPHDLKMVANLKISRRINMTSNLVYNTGRPVTYPVAFYRYNNTSYIYYSARNSYRVPDYVRLDFAATFNGNLKAKKLNHSSFTFTVYNVLGRKNPYSVFFRSENGKINGYQMTIFSQPVFMVTYNFRLLGNATGDF